jgi:hypothetical protein
MTRLYLPSALHTALELMITVLMLLSIILAASFMARLFAVPMAALPPGSMLSILS